MPISGRTLTKALTRSSNARLIKIDVNRAIVLYEYGALTDTEGEFKAQELVHEFCSSKSIDFILEGTRQSGEKQWTKTTVFQCE